MNSLILKTVTGVAVLFSLLGCDLTGNLIGDHKKICRMQGKIVVHDRGLWTEYVDGASRSYLKRKKEFSDTEMAIPEFVEGFEYKFGKNLESTRESVSGEIIRNDIYLLKDKKLAAQFVDFFASYNSIGSETNFNCTGLYPDLYKFDSAVDYEDFRGHL